MKDDGDMEFPLSLDVQDVTRILESTRTTVVVRKPVDMATLEVVPRFWVTPDHPIMNPGNPGAKGGQTYPAGMNQLGAVFAKLDNGRTMGLKPEEFDFLCPYCVGSTRHAGSPGPWCILAEPSSVAWVREGWRHNPPCPVHDGPDPGIGKPCGCDGCLCTLDLVRYQASHPDDEGNWRESGSLPRWASRIVRSVVRVDIVREDGPDAHNTRAPEGGARWVWEIYLRGERPWNRNR
jgi:hypothetical protein